MKIKIQLQGTFYRTPLNQEDTSTVSLVELLRELQTVATQHCRRTPQLLKKSFGLDFLPSALLIKLLQQANEVTHENELYQLPALKLLHSVYPSSTVQITNSYHYQFLNAEANLNLTPDDSQLPLWKNKDKEQPGNYTIILDSPQYSSLTADFTEKIWQDAQEKWNSLSNEQKIQHFLHSLTLKEVTIPLNTNSKLGITLQELPLPLREAITFLRQGEGNANTLSPETQSLIQQYQQNNRIPGLKFPQKLTLNDNIISQQQFCIGKINRQYFKEIIENAQQFILLSSYILEDESLTQLLCEKSRHLPEGVWILTDLRNEVLDRIDTQITTNHNLPIQYQRSDDRKIRCIQQLLNANIRIRSGRFHLKTCISENAAYLGSCNFTPGSLDFNIEAGIIWRNTSVHASLISIFYQYWQQKSKDEVIPAIHFDGFELRPIKTYKSHEHESFPDLLTPQRYYHDLCTQLQEFQGKVFIFSRSFQPSTDLERLLKLSKTQIFIDSQMPANLSSIKIIRIKNLHAKITLLGNRVAYLGGINFNFSKRHSSLNDLMYKTTNTEEIKQIYQLLNKQTSNKS